MKRLLMVSVLLVAFGSSLAAAGSLHARVWLTDRSPLVVRGSGFSAGSHVTVTVTGAGRLVRTVTATKSGTIIARWTVVPAKAGCAALVVRAAGVNGAVATTKVAGIECPQPPADAGP